MISLEAARLMANSVDLTLILRSALSDMDGPICLCMPLFTNGKDNIYGNCFCDCEMLMSWQVVKSDQTSHSTISGSGSSWIWDA